MNSPLLNLKRAIASIKHVRKDRNAVREGTSQHVDDWLDTPTIPTVEAGINGINYAKFVLEFARMSAHKQLAYRQWMEQFKLFCTYEGKRYRVTGASRLGDIWLAESFSRTCGYDLRVDVGKCAEWSPIP